MLDANLLAEQLQEEMLGNVTYEKMEGYEQAQISGTELERRVFSEVVSRVVEKVVVDHLSEQYKQNIAFSFSQKRGRIYLHHSPSVKEDAELLAKVLDSTTIEIRDPSHRFYIIHFSTQSDGSVPNSYRVEWEPRFRIEFNRSLSPI